jgi:CRP-like cAMP-binding protein
MQEFLHAFFNMTVLPGHISYILLITSMLMRRMVWLRLIAVAAGSFSAFYYITISDYVSAFWEVIFTTVNLVQLAILAFENRKTLFSAEEQLFIDTALQHVEPVHCRRVMRLGKWVDQVDGTVLITEDTAPDHLFFVVNGTARVVRHGNQVGVAGPGDFLGEMSYLTGKKATATVTTVTPMRLLVFDRTELRAYLTRHPEVRHALESGFNRNLVDKLVKLNVARPTAPAAAS